MEKYEMLSSQSNESPAEYVKHVEFIDYNYDVEEVIIEGEKQYKYSTFRCNGTPVREEIIRFYIHTKYSIDDEIACINEGDEQYQIDRLDLKAKAEEVYNGMIALCLSK